MCTLAPYFFESMFQSLNLFKTNFALHLSDFIRGPTPCRPHLLCCHGPPYNWPTNICLISNPTKNSDFKHIQRQLVNVNGRVHYSFPNFFALPFIYFNSKVHCFITAAPPSSSAFLCGYLSEPFFHLRVHPGIYIAWLWYHLLLN